MKRVLAIILTGIMTVSVMLVGTPQKTEVAKEKPLIVDTLKIEYLTDYELSLLYTCRKDKRIRDKVNLTQDEADLLMKVARAEAGDSQLAQMWVMRTLLNRIESDNPDFQGIETIGQVIFQKGQFQVVSTGAYKNADVNLNTHLALAMIEGGWDETDGSLWFESSSNTENSWHKRTLTFIREVEGQRYYK